jgi:F subunit of K+-transporting ATPase (Potass_KdpF)
MTIAYWLAAITLGTIAVYLVYALVRAEDL